MVMRLQWHLKAFREVRTSPEMTADVARRVNAIAAAAGEGYEAETETLPTRARGAVYTRSAEAIYDNAKNNTLVRSLDAGR